MKFFLKEYGICFLIGSIASSGLIFLAYGIRFFIDVFSAEMLAAVIVCIVLVPLVGLCFRAGWQIRKDAGDYDERDD